jgi:hypothetical protein
MPRPELSYSTPVKFELSTLKKLREASLQNQRSLSGEVRYRVIQSFQNDADKDQERYSAQGAKGDCNEKEF